VKPANIPEKEAARTVLPVLPVRGLIYPALPKAAMQTALIHKMALV